jgi:hypothetical protein
MPHCLLTGCNLPDLLVNPKDVGCTFLQNTEIIQNNTVTPHKVEGLTVIVMKSFHLSKHHVTATILGEPNQRFTWAQVMYATPSLNEQQDNSMLYLQAHSMLIQCRKRGSEWMTLHQDWTQSEDLQETNLLYLCHVTDIPFTWKGKDKVVLIPDYISTTPRMHMRKRMNRSFHSWYWH